MHIEINKDCYESVFGMSHLKVARYKQFRRCTDQHFKEKEKDGDKH